MNGIPLQVFLLPILAVVAALVMMRRGRAMAAQQDQQHADYRVSALSARLKLPLVTGDPTFNLLVPHAKAEYARGATSERPVHIEVKLDGQHDGVPMRFTYLNRVEREDGIGQVTRKVWSDCKMSADARAPFPAFEVVSRDAPMGPIVKTLALPTASTGLADVDQKFSVATAEPGLARLLGEQLRALDCFSNSGVHLVGDGKVVSFVMRADRAPLMPSAIYHAEAMQKLVCSLARAMGG